MCGGRRVTGQVMPTPIRYHSRHIPKEHLNLDTRNGKRILGNGLCDTLEPDVVRRLADCGVTLVETRAVWWEMEPKPGVYDLTRLERDLDKTDRAGMQAGIFPWFQHPPTWYDPKHATHARFRCLRHGEDSSILSLWDPKTLEVYDRLYSELARRTAERIAFLYAGISGDYGEVCTPSGVKHYLFSPGHGHAGFWCGDPQARRSFARFLERRYGSLDKLNRAWATSLARWHDDLMPPFPIREQPLRRRRDFADWYTGSLLDFTDAVCRLVRRHFPKTHLGIPLGFPHEALRVGQIKSQAVKVAARHDVTARWTGMGCLRSFPKTDVLAKRFASAARFYGTRFATERAGTLQRNNAANALYESFANAAAIVHDDPGNIFRTEEIQRRLRPRLVISEPICRAAVLYPLDDEQLWREGFRLRGFIDRAARLRAAMDYELCDRYMIRDGFLDTVSDLVVLVPTWVTTDAAARMRTFLARGGRIWLCGKVASLAVLDGGKARPFATKPVDVSTAAVQALTGKLIRTDGAPPIPPIAELGEPPAPEAYGTLHQDCVSWYVPGQGRILVS